jgi:RNA polymerase sigma-70 factor (ECF subfamily)
MNTHDTDRNDDQSLVNACRKGDVAAFEGLVLRHQRMVLNVAFRMLGNYEDACDITQNAFLAAYCKFGEFRGAARFSTWLTAIVINLSRNRLQQLKSRQRREAWSLDDPPPGSSGASPSALRSEAPSALQQLEEEELRRAVRRCIEALDAGFREVLVLRDMQEFSYDEVAGALGLREGTVKSRLFRARDAVKDCLKRSMGIVR